MAQEIYHRSEWGNPTETWGNVYLNADLTNELYKRASEYENSWVTDQLLNGVGIKPSIILTPTAYEDGVLNSVKPSNPFGSELVINGSFETDSDWTKGSGWSIADGKAYYSGITNSDLAQSGILTSGKLYKLQYEVINSTLVNGVVKLSGTTASAQNVLSQTVGTHTLYFTADGTTPTSFNIRIVLNTIGQFELDNVSVKEVLHADFDFTRGSSATRVNEQGLVEDVQILSGELVQNGDFEQIGSELVTNGDFSDGTNNWTFSSGCELINEQARIYSSDGSFQYISQSNILTVGKFYKLTFDVISTDGNVLAVNNIALPTETTGSKEIIFKTPFNYLQIKRSSGITDVTIDNVSVKEVGQNWTVTNDDANNYVEFNQDEGTVRLKFLNTSPLTTLSSDTQYLSGNKYKLIVDVKEVVSGGIKIDAAGVSELFNSVGVQERIIEPTGNSFISFYRATANVDITLNSVSLIEITDDTDLPRINYTNFSYEDVLGDELVTNGDFSDGTNNWGGTATLSVVNGRLKLDGIAGQTADQTLTAIVGKKYQVSYDLALGTATSGALIITGGNYPTLDASEGTNTFISTATSTSFRVRPRLGTDGTMFIDNVSVKELTEDVVVPYSGEGSLLLEPSRTNVLLHSNSLDQWATSTSIDVTSNQIGVGGSNDAWLINRTDTGARYVQASSTVSGTQVLSFYAKANTTDWIWVFNGTNSCYLDIANGVEGTSVGFSDIKFKLMDNSWYRISLKANNTTTYTRFYPSRTNGAVSGNTDLSFYLQYCGLEQGSYATSYIPTNGSTVTRLADVCNNSGNSDLINSTEGVLYAEISALANDGTVRYFGLNDSSNNNRAVFLFDGTANRVRAIVSSGGTKYVDFNYTVTDLTEFHKIALKYKTDDFALWIDGVERNTDTSGLTPVGLDNLEFDLNTGGALYGNVKCVAVFKEALSDEELQKLTTI